MAAIYSPLGHERCGDFMSLQVGEKLWKGEYAGLPIVVTVLCEKMEE